jgi:hypothetical protein
LLRSDRTVAAIDRDELLRDICGFLNAYRLRKGRIVIG